MLGRKRSVEETMTTSSADASSAAATTTADDNNNLPTPRDGGDDEKGGESAAPPPEGAAAAASGAEKKPAGDDTAAAAASPLLPQFSSIDRMRLEAVFHPKFENENASEQTIRRQMKERIEVAAAAKAEASRNSNGSNKGASPYLEVTLKHSGSLGLWSGGNRFYSKNSADNRFSLTCEVLLRQHFVRAYWNVDDQNNDNIRHKLQCYEQTRFDECSAYVEQHRLTLAFEVVTAVLGDHGERPQRDFLILTAVADRSRETFLSTTELVEFAHRFRLPHNDCYVFATPDSVDALFGCYDSHRATGTAATVVPALQACADAHVPSMYPHAAFQGDLLEGIVIRYVPNTSNSSSSSSSSSDDALQTMKDLSKKARALNDSLTDLPDCFQLVQESQRTTGPTQLLFPPVLSTSVRTLFEEEGRRCTRSTAGTDINSNNSPDSFEGRLRDLLRRSGSGHPVLCRAAAVAGEGQQQQRGEGLSRARVKTVLLPVVEELARSDDRETRRIASAIQRLASTNAAVEYSLFREQQQQQQQQLQRDDGDESTAGGSNSSTRLLLVVHVMHDTTFRKFEKNRKPTQMKLFRGFVIELLNGSSSAHNTVDSSLSSSAAAPPMDVDDDTNVQVGVEEEEEGEEEEEPLLMLKMKFLPYMVRTFGCRNGLSVLTKGGGPDAFLKYTNDLLTRWQMPREAFETWQPFFRAWAFYAQDALSSSWQQQRRQQTMISDGVNDDDDDDDDSEGLPLLTSTWYLDHFDHFECLYRDGKMKYETSEDATFAGLVTVVALDESTASAVANMIREKVGSPSSVLPLKAVTPEKLLIACQRGHGVVSTATVAAGPAVVRKLSKEKAEAITLILVGCTEAEVAKRDYADEILRKKALGMVGAWRKSNCACVLDLPLSAICYGDSANTITEEQEFQPGPEFDSLIQRVQEVSDKLVSNVRDERIGLLVFFPAGIPGCGKSSLLDAATVAEVRRYIESSTEPETTTRNVVVLTGDKVKQKYWSLVTRERLKDRSSVYIADKNAPAPAWGDIAGVAAKTKSIAVPVLPELRTTTVEGVRTRDGDLEENTVHVYPFSLGYLAVCMARVLDRAPGTHQGKLDSGTSRACLVVVKFFCLYRNMSAEAFIEILTSKFTRKGALCTSPPVQVPFFSDGADDQLPEDLGALLVEAIQAYFGCELKKDDADKSPSKYLDDLENRLRKSLKQHRDRILGMAMDKPTSSQRFVGQLVEIICQADSLKSYPMESMMKRSSFVKLASVDVEAESVHNILRTYSGDDRFSPFWDVVLKDRSSAVALSDAIATNPNFVAKTHVTMVHYLEMKQEDMKAAFAPLCGSRVNVKVLALLWSERAAALEVAVASEDENNAHVPSPHNTFPHITFWHASGASAKESNDLPLLLDSGGAHRIYFEDPIDLSGVISLWKSI